MSTPPTTNAPTWNLEPIFPGGSSSPEFAEFRRRLKQDLAAAGAELAQLPPELNGATRRTWVSFILKLQTIIEHLHRAHAFAHCLVSADVDDNTAQQIEADIDADGAAYDNLLIALEALAAKQPDDRWETLFATGEMQSIRFFLDERRRIAREKLPVEQESLVNELAVDGYHAWNRLYEKLAGDLRAEFTGADGTTKMLSFGQISNMMSHPDRAVRRQAYEKSNEMWQPAVELAAMALNSQGGFRVALYKRRGWDSVLKEPLLNYRLGRESLEAMWRVVGSNVSRLKPFIEAKKRMLGIDRFMWYDQTAPLGGSKQKFPFYDSVEFIVDNLRPFSPEMAEFARMAIDNRWVEAEDRPGKRAGGYCTGFGNIRESRIFMTYSESYNGLRILAHELGHAWHSWTMRQLPYYGSRYALNVAEAASTFNELLVADAALEQAADNDTKLMLLDQKLTNAFVFMCNIYARYLFDCAFYEKRKTGTVGSVQLSEMMREAQRKAFGDLLDPEGFHDLFWATKLHFFLTAQPFYNFPYTFGYLFSNGIYARARAAGPAFSEDYKNLLRDTGRMSTEDLARKHLGVDLAHDDFWQSALDRILADVEKFEALAG
jgi:pepF/M3 family oligoendopeptidase